MTGRPKVATDPNEEKKLLALRKKASANIQNYSKDQTRDMNHLEKIAWLVGAQRPTSEIMQAIGSAKEAGFLWRQISTARGSGTDDSSGRKVSSLYREWQARQTKE